MDAFHAGELASELVKRCVYPVNLRKITTRQLIIIINAFTSELGRRCEEEKRRINEDLDRLGD